MYEDYSQEQVILASSSPRRAELMEALGIPFEVMASGADETVDPALPPDQAAIAAACAKARTIQDMTMTQKPIIACDTIVVLDGEIYGKPRSKDDASDMLHKLSGRTHEVVSGVCLSFQGKQKTFAETTEVTFYPLSDKLIRAYVDTGEPMDKAGGYGIQGKGMVLVDHIDGDYCNVVGLPVARVTRELLALTDPTWEER